MSAFRSDHLNGVIDEEKHPTGAVFYGSFYFADGVSEHKVSKIEG